MPARRHSAPSLVPAALVSVPTTSGAVVQVDMAALWQAVMRQPLRAALPGETVPVQDATHAFIKHHEKHWKPETLRWERTVLARFASFFPQRSIASLTAADLMRWLDGLSKMSVPSQRSRWYAIAQFLTWCRKRAYVAESPVEGVERHDLPWIADPESADGGKPCLRNSAEVRVYLQTASKWLLPMDRVATALPLLTGMCGGETMAVRACDVDWDLRRIWIRGKRHRSDGWDVKKAKRERCVLLPEELEYDLRRLVDDAKCATDRLFPIRRKQERHRVEWLNRQVHATCIRAGVRDVPTHGLRGTWSTMCSAAGMDLPSIGGFLGHADEGQTARAHYVGVRQPDPLLPRALRTFDGAPEPDGQAGPTIP